MRVELCRTVGVWGSENACRPRLGRAGIHTIAHAASRRSRESPECRTIFTVEFSPNSTTHRDLMPGNECHGVTRSPDDD